MEKGKAVRERGEEEKEAVHLSPKRQAVIVRTCCIEVRESEEAGRGVAEKKKRCVPG